MLGVVMAKDLFGSFAVAYADDHGVVVACIGEVDTVWQHLSQGGECGIVGYIARGED